MSNDPLDSLLKPSLEPQTQVGKPFSSTAHFLLGWFGGGIASAFFCILSAHKMGLLKQAWLILAVFMLFSVSVTIYLSAIYRGIIIPPFSIEILDAIKVTRILSQLFGVLVYGLFYLMFKKYLNAARLGGEPYPSPWAPAILCGLLGGGMVAGLAGIHEFYYGR